MSHSEEAPTPCGTLSSPMLSLPPFSPRSSRASSVAAMAALLVGCAGAPGPEPQEAPTPSPWRTVSPTETVRLALASLLVAPAKETGLPWDGPGQLPAETTAAMRSMSADLRREIGVRFLSMQTIGAVADLAPWAFNLLSAGTAPPDVMARVSMQGTTLIQAPTVRQSFAPTWPNAFSPPVHLHDGVAITVDATDEDLMFHDHIGTCSATPPLRIDRDGYVDPRQWVCPGQLWAVRLRIEPALTAP